MININPKKLMCFILIIFSLPTILYAYTQMPTSKEGLYEVDSISLEKIMNGKDTLFVYVGRPTCPQCKEFEPILRKVLNNQHQSMGYYNTDNARKENEDKLEIMADSLGINSIPAIIKIVDGKVIDRIIGLKNEKAIEEFILNG
ncbi:thioredoxin family protein [Enterococcus hirae]|nr:thioredoxin family protein [Enterococcus hirae]